MAWAGRRVRARLAVAGVTLGALVTVAPAVSAATLGARGGGPGSRHSEWGHPRPGLVRRGSR